MNTSSHQLLTKHRHEGVRHAYLSEMVEYSRTRVDAADLNGKNFVGVDNLVPNKGGRVDASFLPNTRRLTAYEPGDILLGNIRPYLKKIWRATNSGGCSGDVLAVRIKQIAQTSLIPEFLYYALSSDRFFTYNMQHAKGAKMPRGNKTAILNFVIPVPPLEVQRAIVEVLDTFSKLEAELEAELEARKQQYGHYREHLLAHTEASELKPLGEVVRIRNGKDHKHLDSGEVPVYGSGGIMRYVNSSSAHGPSVLIPRKGSLSNLYYVEGPFWNVDTIFSTEIDTTLIEPKFLFHQLTIMKLGEMNQAGGVPSQTQSALNRLRLSVPSIDQQRRIVAILDKFEALVSDLSKGLPAELAARRQQYEYYRDKLLTFKELEAAT